MNAEVFPPSKLKLNEGRHIKSDELFNFLSDAVPALLKEVEVGGIIKYIIEEDDFMSNIGKYLEKFICGKSCPGGFDELKSFGKPSKFCGKVFNVGDPTYTCT